MTFTFLYFSGNDEIHVEVAVGCKSIVYKIESRHNESVTPVLKSKNLSDLVNNGVLIRKIKSETDQVNGDVGNVDSINIPSEMMLLALAFPCRSVFWPTTQAYNFYQPRSGMVMQNCRSKKEKRKRDFCFLGPCNLCFL